jgi:23S rRNA pseudouridine1911/1915/1917 synthase
MTRFSYLIKSHDSGKRLDTFLAVLHPRYTRGELSRAIESHQATVNHQPTKPGYRLKTGDIITLELPKKTPPTLSSNPDLPVKVIFENPHILVLDKPADIQTHPSATESHNTVANWLVAHFPAIASIGEDSFRPGIVHRLDKNTSGLLVVAKTQEAFKALKVLFAQRLITKTYLALVYGHLHPAKGVIDKPIARSQSLRKQAIADNQHPTRGTARKALTEYRVLQSLDSYDLVEAKPKTGRMHQIRVHLASLGHPVVGDTLYTPRNIKRSVTQEFSRHFLHAHQLSFRLFGNSYEFSSALPADFQTLLNSLPSKPKKDSISTP